MFPPTSVDPPRVVTGQEGGLLISTPSLARLDELSTTCKPKSGVNPCPRFTLLPMSPPAHASVGQGPLPTELERREKELGEGVLF